MQWCASTGKAVCIKGYTYGQAEGRRVVMQARVRDGRTFTQQGVKGNAVSNALTRAARTAMWPHQDSNLDLEFRKLLFYPLNYGAKGDVPDGTNGRKSRGDGRTGRASFTPDRWNLVRTASFQGVDHAATSLLHSDRRTLPGTSLLRLCSCSAPMTSHPSVQLQHTAVLFLVFNRPETTAQVFEAIRAARPPRLYVASDGPRTGKPGEAETVKAVRERVLSSIDWPCNVRTLLREENLGCRNAVSSAISWFFEHEEEGIILEDDCLPSSSFFPFCETLLERYRNDPSIAGITGDFRSITSDKHPSAVGRVGYPLIWGWASWRRVWKQYDPTMSTWTGEPNDFPRLAAKPKATRKYLRLVFDAVKNGEIDTWDFQFNFLLQAQRQDFVHPHVNLITNIGFAQGATHTADPTDPNAALPRAEVIFPLTGIVESRTYEAWLDKHIFALEDLPTKAMNKLYRWSSSIIKRG